MKTSQNSSCKRCIQKCEECLKWCENKRSLWKPHEIVHVKDVSGNVKSALSDAKIKEACENITKQFMQKMSPEMWRVPEVMQK